MSVKSSRGYSHADDAVCCGFVRTGPYESEIKLDPAVSLAVDASLPRYLTPKNTIRAGRQDIAHRLITLDVANTHVRLAM